MTGPHIFLFAVWLTLIPREYLCIEKLHIYFEDRSNLDDIGK